MAPDGCSIACELRLIAADPHRHQDLFPSPSLQSPFTHRHRLAWALLASPNGTSSPLHWRLPRPSAASAAREGAARGPPQPAAAADSSHAVEGAGTVDAAGAAGAGAGEGGSAVRYVRAWAVGLIPLHAADEAEYCDARGRRLSTRCGIWSCEMPREPLLRVTTLAGLRRRFGHAPHREQLPRPQEYGAHRRGYAHLARDGDAPDGMADGAAGSPPVHVAGDPLAFSCLFASHGVPERWHPSSCRSRARLL